MEDKVYKLVSQVCGVPIATVTEESSPDTIDTWDSMSHIHLILALESEFDIELTPEDSMDMLSVKLIRLILQDHGVSLL